jgi:hypothetical protein
LMHGGEAMASEVLRTPRWRPIGWGAAVALLALPFVAMQFTREVNWRVSDFIIFGAMLLAVGVPLELVARTSRNWAYRGAALLALFGAFLTVWANLAVGIVGSEENPENLLFFAALLVGIAGMIAARARPKGMALAMVATAAAIGIAFGIASIGPSDEPNVPSWRELLGTGVFAGLFLGSAALFRNAGREA